jgi:simple sugar transport system ATP-binding protein
LGPGFLGGAEVITIKDLTKRYPNGFEALKGVNLSVKKGEIHSIVGENGAGKTTLMNIIFGLIKPTTGSISMDDKEVNISSTGKAIEMGIGMVHQHFMIVPNLSVMENVVLGSEKDFTNFFGKIDYKSIKLKVGDLIKKLKLSLSPEDIVRDLPIGKQQLVEILKVLYKGPEIIILDEPTAVLVPTEVNDFLDFVINLKNEGKTVIFISHRLKEVFKISDSITVLRNGKTIGSYSKQDITRDEVANLMIGKKFDFNATPPNNEKEEILFSVDDLSLKGMMIKNISFNIKKGEILGVAGVEGNGQEDLFSVLTGDILPEQGSVKLVDKELNKSTILEKRKAGIAYITDDRIKNGLAIDRSILENGIAYHHKDQKLGKVLINNKNSEKLVTGIVEDYDVRGVKNMKTPVSSLSGGNMQKLLVGRELNNQVKLLIASQPTSGVDIAAKALIHDSFKELTVEGNSVLLISSDLDELMSISNRIIVLYRGKIVAEFKYPDYDIKELSYYMTGLKES